METEKNLNTVKYWNGVYKGEFEDGEMLKEDYHRNYKNVFDKTIELIPDGSSVLDVACGSGIFCRLLKERKPKCRITGVDFSDFIIGKNGERDRKKGIRYVQQDIRKEFQFKKKFDVVVMSEIIEHFKNPEKIMDNVVGSLKKGGMLIVSCPHDEDVMYWMRKNDVVGEHQMIITHDYLFHLLAKYSDEVRFVQLKTLRPDWIEWHIFAYIKKA